MLLVTKKVYLPLLLSVVLCGSGSLIAANAQTSGYVPVTFNQNPVEAGQQVVIGSALDSCLALNPVGAGTLSIYVSTTESGGSDWGRDFGDGIIFNSIDEGDQFNAATYYFSAYYTTSGSGDPCDSVATPSSSPEWAALSVTGD